MIMRAKIIISGTVQSVGYREEVHEAAFDLDLVGTVRNLEDGTVEIICEGERDRIEALSRRIHIRQYPVKVADVRTEYSAAAGEFKEFKVIKDEKLDEDIIRNIKMGFVYMKRMHRDLGDKQDRSLDMQDRSMDKQDATLEAVKTMDSHIQGLDGHIRQMDGHIQSMDDDIRRMDSNMGGHFDRLDVKYGEFGDTMNGMAADIRAIRKTTAIPKRRKRHATSLYKAGPQTRPDKKA